MATSFVSEQPSNLGSDLHSRGSPIQVTLTPRSAMEPPDFSGENRRQAMLRATAEARTAQSSPQQHERMLSTPDRTRMPMELRALDFGSLDVTPVPDSHGRHQEVMGVREGLDAGPRSFRFVGEGRGAYEMVNTADAVDHWMTFGAHPASGMPRGALLASMALCLVLAAVVLLATIVVLCLPSSAFGNGEESREVWSGLSCGAGLSDEALEIDVASWSHADRAWCCENRRVGCPTTWPTTTVLGQDYDCQDDFVHWRSSWSDNKKDWCCYKYGRGCDEE